MEPRRDIEKLIDEEKWGGFKVRSEDRIAGELMTFNTAIVSPLFPQTVVMEGLTAEQLSHARTQADRSTY